MLTTEGLRTDPICLRLWAVQLVEHEVRKGEAIPTLTHLFVFTSPHTAQTFLMSKWVKDRADRHPANKPEIWEL